MIRIAILAALLATSANAQVVCVPSHEVMNASLKDRFGESVQMIGLLPSGKPFYLYANPQTKTWTVVIDMPDGQACSPASGTHFAQPPQGDPA